MHILNETEMTISALMTEHILILSLSSMLNFFSNKPYILNFYLQLPVGTIQEIYENNLEYLGEDLYIEELINASIHNS